MAAIRRRVCQLSSIPGFGASKTVSSFERAILDPSPVSGARHCSQSVKYNRKHLFFVDTLALVNRLEGEGVSSKQAEMVIGFTTEVLNDSLESMSQSLVSKEEIQKIEMRQESNLSKLIAELKSTQGRHFSLLQHETEKLKNDVEKMGIELRHGIDKVRHEIHKDTARQRSDFILEMGKIREELSKQTSKLDGVNDNMTIKINKGLDCLRAQLEARWQAVRYDNMKYFMGTIASIATMVPGRFVNAYSRTDWMLGVAFRVSLLMKGLAGIQPVDIPGIQNFLPHNEGENYIYVMLAFPLLELGRMEEAEKAARRGFEINKQDNWAQHALCHVLQYKCYFREAVKFMEECSSSWGSSSFMLTHNWWHVALCYLEGNAPRQRVLEIYDNYIWKELDRNDSLSAEVYLNAAGLLLRLYVRGELDIIGDRLKMLAECLTNQENWYMEWHFDVLIVWTLAKTGEISKAEDLLKGLKNRFLRMTKKKQQRMQRGMMLAEALYTYGIADDKRGRELLNPDFDATDYKIIGASDEQVDVFNEVWYNMLLNTGNALKAIEVLEKQIKKRDGVPYLWRLLESAYKLANKPEERIANEKATALESRYFN